MSALSQAWSSNPLTQISARFLQKKKSSDLTQGREGCGSSCPFLSPEPQLSSPRAHHGMAEPGGAGRVAEWQKGHLQLGHPLGALLLSLWSR